VIHKHLQEALAWGPTDIVVLAGVNDLASGRTVEQVERDLVALWGDVRRTGTRLVVVTILPWARWRTVANRYVAGGLPFGEEYRGATVEVNRRILGASLPDASVDTSSLGDSVGRLLSEYDSGDGLHPNVAGHRALAKLIAAQAF